MVQEVVAASPIGGSSSHCSGSAAPNSLGTRPAGRRARNRQARYDAYLATAKHLVATEGLDALSMHRLADAVDAAVGTVYTYFPSKSALVAAVQRDAIDRLTRSYVAGRALLEDHFAAAAPANDVAALARLVAFGRWFAETVDVFPEEAHLLQLLMAELRPAVDTTDAEIVLPSALLLLDHARVCFAAAAEAGVLDDADPMERTVVMAAALNGVLLLSRLDRFDPVLFDGPRLAAALVGDLLRGWGADPQALAAATAIVDAAGADRALTPLVPDHEVESPE